MFIKISSKTFKKDSSQSKWTSGTLFLCVISWENLSQSKLTAQRQKTSSKKKPNFSYCMKN